MLLAAPRLLPQDQTSPKTEQKPTPSGTTPPPPKPAPTTPLMKFQYMKGTFEPMGDLYVLALGGGVDLNLSDVKAGEQELEAETVVLWLDRSDLLEEFAERGERLPTITPGEKTVFEAFVGLRSLREFYAEGSVRFHQGPATIEAERMYLNLREGHGLMEDVTARARYPRKDNTIVDIILRAQEMRQIHPKLLRADDAQFTSCPYGLPHYHIRSEKLDYEGSLLDSTTPGVVDASGNHLVVDNSTVTPLPGIRWTVGDEPPIPLRSVAFGHSTRFGFFGLIGWGGDMSPVGQSVQDFLGVKGEFKGEWLLSTDYYSRRGFGEGVGFNYSGRQSPESREPDLYFGKIRTYFIHDRQDEDGNGAPIDHHDRGMATTQNRFFLPDKFQLDAELDYISDSNFLNEYFQKIAQEEQEQQTYLYLKKLWGSQGFTLLGRWRLNEFDTQTEYLPQAQFRSIEQPLFQVPFLQDQLPGGALVYHTNFSEASIAQLRLSNELPPTPNIDTPRVLRIDSLDRFSLPFDVGPYGMTVFYDNRVTYFSHTPGAGAAWRYEGAAGANVSTVFSRVFDVKSDLLNLDGLRHVLIPSVEYLNRFADTLPADELFGIDSIDSDNDIESVVLRLDQRLQTRQGTKLEVREFVRLLLEQPIFPDADRDNVGNTLGLFHEELTVSSGIDKYPLKNLRIFAESDYDWYDHKFAQVGLGFGVEPTERIVFSSAYRVLTSPVVETSRVLTNELVYRFSPKYQVALLEQDDLTGGFIAQRSITLRRFGHDYVCELSYNVDQGSSERGIAISFTPLVLWRNKTRPTFPAGDRPILTPDLGQ